MTSSTIIFLLYWSMWSGISGCIKYEDPAAVYKSNFNLEGSTPGDPYIKQLFGIKPDVKVDFIRWVLILNPELNSYQINLQYGEGKNNTLDFIDDGHLLSRSGFYTTLHMGPGNNLQVLQLKDRQDQLFLQIVRFNYNLYHLMDTNNKLLIGNGGWSYSLQRSKMNPDSNVTMTPLLNPTLKLAWEAPGEYTFDGRTPCIDFANIYNIPITSGCFKLKWRLILKNEVTGAKTFVITRIEQNPEEVKGSWNILTDAATKARVLEIRPNSNLGPFYFCIADEAVLFFLDKNKKLMVGNKDFSYTLNRVK